MRVHSKRGLALVLVMTVVLALTIVATPFVLSMILQERSGTAARYGSQADYGAEGAKNYALWRLMSGLDPVERRTKSGIFSSYFYDTRKELDIRLDDISLQGIKIADPKGAIWGISVQDEQGKLNVRTAPVSAITTLSQLVDGRVANLKDYLTMYSGRDTTWGYPQRIRPTESPPGTPAVTVDNLTVLGPQSRVRATKPGMKPLETVITGNGILLDPPDSTFTTRDSISAYLNGVIEVEMRHTVNINTAKRETLVALFEGLRYFGMADSLVDRSAASDLARTFAGREIQRLEEFLLVLEVTGLKKGQKAAVALNALRPNSVYLQGSGTAPLCFKSYDVHTLEAFSSMNNPSGVEVAGRGFREVVSVSPPSTLTLACESQYDFNQMRTPFGNRILTYPNPIAKFSDIALKPNKAYVTMSPTGDYRGVSGLGGQLTGWPDNQARDHFSVELEGKQLNGTTHLYPWTQIFTTNHLDSSPPPPIQQLPDVAAGGFEIWARFDSISDPQTIFDIRENESSNRLTLRIEAGELILTACDGTLGVASDLIDNGMAEVRQPFTMEKDTWTHFGAYWKGTQYAQLALLVDGFAHPQQRFTHVSPEGNKIITKLSSALTASPTGSILTLQDDSFLPPYPTPLLIGEEIVMYDKTGAISLVRGARGTVARAHPAQTTVSIFGYSSKVRNTTVRVIFANAPTRVLTYTRIPIGGAKPLYKFGATPRATVDGDKQDPVTGMWQIDALQTDIGVLTTNIEDYPDQGYIRIDDEVIFYMGRSIDGVNGKGNAKFTGCERAQHNTAPAIHFTGRQVQLWSIAVTSQETYDSPTILQIGDEWFGPVQKDTTRSDYWISFVDGSIPVDLVRGGGMGLLAHSVDEDVIPTFVAREVNPWPITRKSLGRGDLVTVMDGANLKEPAGVPRVRNVMALTSTIDDPFPGQIAAFEKNVSREYSADDLHVRILKFPSGELLGLNWLQLEKPNFTIGPISGTIDEVKAFAAPKDGKYLTTPLDSGANTAILSGVGLGRSGGLLKIGDEYIGYGQADQLSSQVDRMKRGWLNSTAEIHDQGDGAFYLPWIPVSTLANDLTETDRVIELNQPLSSGYSPGYGLIDNEMILFEENSGSQTLRMPPRWDGTSGLYRGMFGTQAAIHSASNSLVYGLPWRVWDTYKAREFDNSMVYYQWSTKMDLARWHSFRWDQEIPMNDPNVVVHALCRIDGKGEFWDPPGMSDKALLIDSITPGVNVKINRTGYLNQAGQLDIRFYVEYRPGSFDPANSQRAVSWKRAPKIKEIRVEYDRPVQTLYHEDR